jgi:hypothetical protein
MSIVILVVSINLIISAVKIILKDCVVNTEDSNFEQPIAGSQE